MNIAYALFREDISNTENGWLLSIHLTSKVYMNLNNCVRMYICNDVI